jgi:hypothetical protein
MDRAPDSKSGCWGFKSLLACHFFLNYGFKKYANKNNIAKDNPVSQRGQGGAEESNLADPEADVGFDGGCNNYRFYHSDLSGYN